jgi:hypothetical protein
VRIYTSYSFTTSVLDGGAWSASRPGRAFPPGKGPVVQETGSAPELVWTQSLEEKSFCLCIYLDMSNWNVSRVKSNSPS